MDRCIGSHPEEALEVLALDSIPYYGYIFATATMEFKDRHESLHKQQLIVAMKIYVICPVRNARKADLKFAAEYVKKLESQGMIVHIHQETLIKWKTAWIESQRGKSQGYNFVWWDSRYLDPKSYGSHFDLVMAFMLRAIRECPIVVVRPLKRTLRKSYTNVLLALAKNSSL